MFQLALNNDSKHVCSEYSSLISSAKRDRDCNDSIAEKEHETTIIFLVRLDD